MKKVIVFSVVMFCLFPSLALGDELVILAPKGGTYAQGSEMTIEWDYTILSVPVPTNPIQRKVFVKVDSPSKPPGTLFVQDFTADLNAQKYNWIVDKPPGTYALHFLVNFTQPPIKISSQPFTIEEGPLTATVVDGGVTAQVAPAPTVESQVAPAPTVEAQVVPPPPDIPVQKIPAALLTKIEIFSPLTGKNYYIGDNLPIKWNKEKIKKYSYVNIQYCYPDGKAATGTYPAPNTGSYDASLAGETTEASWRIKIFTQDNKYSGLSGVFHIKKKPIPQKRKKLRGIK